MFGQDIGIDLGTSTVLVYVKGSVLGGSGIALGTGFRSRRNVSATLFTLH